ncbi:hypothetical protein BDC45DRAFT_471139 [Circinella umbellata]|nr:hypothetical protein BDC45DRAFT_471139 [Circinella umbellata]
MSSSNATPTTANVNNDTTTPVSAEQLKNFLQEAPAMYKYRLHRGAERQILTNCYRLLWGNNRTLMKKYFFTSTMETGDEDNDDSDNLSTLLEKYNLFKSSDDDNTVAVPSNPDNVLVDSSIDEPEYWESQRGKQCGHLFKKGESVYRCRTCGLDDTCVLCARCFHATNHDGHDVKIWISRGAGGCCDCGDPEAWKIPLECSIHSLSVGPSTSATSSTAAGTIEDASTRSDEQKKSTSRKVQLEPISSVTPELLQQIKATIQVVMDYILETFATSPEDLSLRNKQQIEQDCEASDKALGMIDNGHRRMYACILWNDERHSFDEVIDVVKRATGCTKLQASKVAESVDAYGRHVIETSSRLDDLIPIATEINQIRLAVTIRSCKDTVREQISGLLLDWLKDLISGRFTFFSNVQGGNCILRDIICEVLCEDYSLRPELAALSTRSRRGTVSDADLDYDFEFDGTGTEDEAGEVDPGEDMFDGAMMVDDGEEMFFQPPDVDIDWIEAGDEEDDGEFQPEGSDYGDYEDEDDSDSDDIGPRIHNPYTSQDVEMRNASDDDDDDTHDQNDRHQRLRRRQQEVHQDTRSDAGDATTSPPPHSPHTHQRFNSPPITTTEEATTSSAGNTSAPRTPPHRRHSPGRQHDIIDLKYDLNEWLTYTDRLEREERNTAKMLDSPLSPNCKQLSETDENIKREFNRKLRLDYLLQYDLRLWKTARASIKDLLIGTLVSNFDYRPIIGIRFARNYPELLDAFFLKDREPEHSITTLSVQLLTVPTVAATLVKEYKFFGIACSILANFFLTDNIHMLLPEEYHNMQVDCSSRAIKRPRFAMTFYDIRYVLNAELVKSEVCHQPLYLRHFLDMLFQFQAMDPLVRKDNVHVEYESTSWVNAFNVTLQISKLCRLFADCFVSLYQEQEQQKSLEASQSLVRSILRVLYALQTWSPRLTETAAQVARQAAGPTSINEQGETIDQHGQVVDEEGYGYLIKGVDQQKMKSFESPAAGEMTIIKYDIAKEPVSFHHPYHWLLAELLSHVRLLKDDTLRQLGWTNGFKSVLDKFNEHDSSRETFLAILEYPLRMRALLAQANCGVWVRNGFGIRNQARTYRDVSVREYTYDWDLYLLQVGLAMTRPDHMLATMIDRFDITNWFNGKPEKAHPYYDASQMTTMVEEFTDFLVICATERGYASNMPIEEKIRRAIIQYLGLSSMAYSELVKVLPDSLSDHASFDQHLSEISDYKPPSGLNDHGRYELKDEYYNDLDPYFWQFSRNQREEAFEKLRIRHNKNARDKQEREVNKEEFFILPKLRKIPKDGPFKYFGNFLQSHMMVQIVLYALWNSRTAKSSGELILDDALYLAMVAVTDENTEAFCKQQTLTKGKSRANAPQPTVDSFVEYATNDKFPVTVGVEREHISLLTVLLRFMGDKEYKHIHERCKYIIEKMEERGCPDEAKQMISEWRALHQAAQETTNEEEKNDAAAKYEKKKAEAKARQANIMAQFAQAQSQFMSQYADMYDDEEDEDNEESMDKDGIDHFDQGEKANGDVERTCHFPAGTCIVCQEELDRSRLYGVLGLVQKSKTVRETPLHNSEVMFDVFETAQGRDTWKQHVDATTQDKNSNGSKRTTSATSTTSTSPVLNGFPTDAHVEGLHISTCGHLMHAHCFNGYQESVDSDTINPLRALMPQLRHKQFLCPLCKALGNVLLPIVWKGKKESYPGPMAPKTSYQDLDDMAKDLMNQLENEIGLGDRKMPGGIDEDMDPQSSELGVEIENVDALRRLYNQLRTAMKGGNSGLIIQDGSISPGQLRASLLELYNMYAYAIASMEIAQRGDHGVRARDLSVEHTGTYLDDISSQNQTLLKILAKTGELMPNVMNIRWVTEDRYTMQRISLGVLRQIFYDETLCSDGLADSEILRKPLLLADPFETLTRIGFIIKSPSKQQHNQEISNIDVHHFMRLLYVAEITKTVIGLLQGFKTEVLADQKVSQSYQRLSSSSSTSRSTQESEAAKRFACDIAGLVGISETTLQDFFAQVSAHVFASLIRTFTLPYLRKALLLMVVHHGFILQPLDWEQEDEDMDDDDEYDYLARILRLPALTQVFNLEPFEQGMILGWCKHYCHELQQTSSTEPTTPTTATSAITKIGTTSITSTTIATTSNTNKQSPTLQQKQKQIIPLRLPTPYYLVSLPYRMDQLFEESARRVCRKCGNLPEYPALCLVCGTFVCARRYCCTENDRGECNTHMRSCSGDIGIFVVVKESLVLLLHADGGSIMNAPYLDTHGEVDLFLRRGTPQYLNPQRYEQIRQMWLSHAVPAFVRRKMESSYSYTRWESW